MGWADSLRLRLLEGTLAEGGRRWPTPEAPNGKTVTTTPFTVNKHILTVLLQMTSSFQVEVGVPGGWDSWGPESRILGCLSSRWSAELKEPA